MTSTSSDRFALAVVASLAFVLRVVPFFGAEGPWTYRVDYDEGVYFTAASLLLKGFMPYRDFVFVHPPGIVLFLAGTSAWSSVLVGVDGAFALARWIASGLGVLNVVLVWAVTLEWSRSRWAALFAAFVYATYPEIVQVERGPFIEPLLNACVLAMTLSVMTKRFRLAAVLAGVAMAFKLWAAMWIVGALWALPDNRERVRFTLLSAGVFFAAVLPFALLAPVEFVKQTLFFHFGRPPDGFPRLQRFEQIVALRHLASPILATASLFIIRHRIVTTAWVLTLISFFATAAWWSQYNAHLVASEAVLAGAFVSWVLKEKDIAGRGFLFAGAVFLCISLFFVIKRIPNRGEDHLALARMNLPKDQCVFSFEPSWMLAAGRLPTRPLVVDSYAMALMKRELDGIEDCEWVAMGVRGKKQLTPEQRSRLRGRVVLE
ncbi:MAG: hypothetical protein DI536_17715 [Archangium gephyra]|uniref:DUF2029 domain-containing protein n=1 Tax=Archangium gephyra TaxID=48 RepID=A0A2W5V6M7_9BACT|nr:MAG: hypothetical protein DI536_17715 [Archangium gephyra]